jgi:hypothetical protein
LVSSKATTIVYWILGKNDESEDLLKINLLVQLQERPNSKTSSADVSDVESIVINIIWVTFLPG